MEELVEVDLEMVFSVRRAADGDGSVTIVSIANVDHILHTPFDVVLAAWKEYLEREFVYVRSLN